MRLLDSQDPQSQNPRRYGSTGVHVGLASALTLLMACGGSESSGSTSNGGGGSSTVGGGGTSTASAGAGTGGSGGSATGGSAPTGKLEVLAGEVGAPADVDGPQGTSRLLDVGGMAFLAPHLYVADRRHHLRRIHVDTRETTTAVNDAGAPVDLFQPIALARASDNELYVLHGLQTQMDGVVGQLARYNVASGFITGELTADSDHTVPYDITVPVPLAMEEAGTVLIGDKMRLDPMTYVTSDIGIRQVWGTSATLSAWVPAGSSVYTAHRYPSMVLKSDLAALTWELVAGEDQNPDQPAVDGPKGASRFSTSVGGADSDGQGHLFVADTNANAIRKVDLATGSVTTVVGEISPSGSIVTGDLANARLHHPVWVTWLGGGRLAIGCPEDFVVLIADGL